MIGQPQQPPLRVAAFTGGWSVPSARFRVRQYIDPLKAAGVTLDEFMAPLGAYPPRRSAWRPLWAAATLGSRLPAVAASYRYDVTLHQREMVSTFATLESWTSRPRVLDVDDAIWVFCGGRAARKLAEACDLVIAGNAFLAEQFRCWNRDVRILPTGVDTDRYSPAPTRDPDDALVVGWSGLSANYHYLYEVEAALATALGKFPEAELHVVADRPPTFRHLGAARVRFTPWSPAAERQTIRALTVGLMPLSDSVWSRGKCSFKMLTYMACGVPVIASPVGMNADVLRLGEVGHAARTPAEWSAALEDLLADRQRARRLGENGRQVVLRHFSTVVLAPRLARYLRDATT